MTKTGRSESNPRGAGPPVHGEGQQGRPEDLAGRQGIAGRWLRLDQLKSQGRQIGFDALVDDVDQVIGDGGQMRSDLVTVDTVQILVDRRGRQPDQLGDGGVDDVADLGVSALQGLPDAGSSVVELRPRSDRRPAGP